MKFAKLRLGSLTKAILGRAIISATLIATFIGYCNFDDFPSPSIAGIKSTVATVVFGGGEFRVSSALQLLNKRLISRVYISGEDLDVYPQGFVEFFSGRNKNISDINRLLICCIEWKKNATNTLQNAQDIKCWISRQKITGTLLLITSHWHMARALALLSAELPTYKILPYPIYMAKDTFPDGYQRRATLEYIKYLATVSILKMAPAWSGLDSGAKCIDHVG